LNQDCSEESFATRRKPCDFLQPDGSCLLGDCKPLSCKEYPHTDKPNRMGSLLSMLDNAEICPVVFEMLERLKQDSDYEEFNESYVEEFREMTRRFKEHAPSGMMSAEEWFAWQKSDNALANRTNQQ